VLSAVEQGFSISQRKRLRLADFADKADLAASIVAFIAQHNERAHPFPCTTRSVALRALSRVRDDLSRITETTVIDDEETIRYQEVAAWADQKIAAAEARGEAREEQTALLAVLRARGVAVSSREEHRVRSCEDAAQLREWITRAATATSLDAVFGAD
jgi:hypothetical protein